MVPDDYKAGGLKEQLPPAQKRQTMPEWLAQKNRPQVIDVKCDMALFIVENLGAHRAQHRFATAIMQRTKVPLRDNLRHEQDQ